MGQLWIWMVIIGLLYLVAPSFQRSADLDYIYDMYDYPTVAPKPVDGQTKKRKLAAVSDSKVKASTPINQTDPINSDITRSHFINVGVRNDYLLQDCTDGTNLKLTFPDIDYSFLGYDILTAYPLAMGSDPGFTYPIFRADYSEKLHTGDCRYSIPKGLVVTPDVSCDVSFSSNVVKTTREYESELAVSASVSGGGWGVQFSASAGYKKAQSEISKGEYSYVISTAKCNYYTSKLQDMPNTRPEFDETFVEWLRILEKSLDGEDYLAFFQRYGTHYPTKVTYGARFTQESRMESSELERMESSGVNVGVSASYSGLFSVGGGFNLDSSQRQKASDFAQKSLTRTITVGAPPPANGDAMTWASTVKQSPVPSYYELEQIEHLFTENFMKDLNINYDRIRRKIVDHKVKYWQSVQRQLAVEHIDFDIGNSLLIPNWYVSSKYEEVDISYRDCYQMCHNLTKCIGLSFCSDCERNKKSKCSLFDDTTRSRNWHFGNLWQTLFIHGEVYLRGIIVSDLANEPMNTIAANIEGTDGSLGLANAQEQCKSTFTKLSSRTSGDKSIAYSFGYLFKQVFAICKIYGTKRTLLLEERSGFGTYLKISK